MEILKKYNYNLPLISLQKFNEYIKEVGVIAKLNRDVQLNRTQGSKHILKENPLHQFMSSHMGRRTAVTILIKRNIPLPVIQKLTNHKDIKTLMKYVHITNEDLINDLEKDAAIKNTKIRKISGNQF